MAKTNTNVHVYSDQEYAVWYAPAGTAAPTTLPPASPGAAFSEVGLLSDAGVTESHNMNENDIYDLSGSLVRIARNQEQRTFTFEALESNPAVEAIRFPGSTVTTTGSTAEVDTVTITGATGGTFVLEGGIGGSGVTGPLANNATSSVVQAAVRTLPGLSTATVTGSGGGPYTVTGPANGESMNLAADGTNLTGTTPTVAVANTTPGVVGKSTRNVGTGTGRNLLSWAIDLVDGNVHRRIVINNGEAVWTGTTTYSSSGAAIYQFTLQAYLDGSGHYYTIISDDSVA